MCIKKDTPEVPFCVIALSAVDLSMSLSLDLYKPMMVAHFIRNVYLNRFVSDSMHVQDKELNIVNMSHACRARARTRVYIYTNPREREVKI